MDFPNVISLMKAMLPLMDRISGPNVGSPSTIVAQFEYVNRKVEGVMFWPAR